MEEVSWRAMALGLSLMALVGCIILQLCLLAMLAAMVIHVTVAFTARPMWGDGQFFGGNFDVDRQDGERRG